MVNTLLGFIGRDKVSISKRVMQGVNKAVAKVSDLEQIACGLAIKKKYDYVICGHIHQPSMRLVENSEGKVIYLNSGDWVENLTALEYRNKNWQLFHFNAKDFPDSCQTETSHTVNVMTEDIMILISEGIRLMF